MGTKEDIQTYVSNTFRYSWNKRDGRVVPTEADLGAGNEGVHLDAVCLYADMAKSTHLVDNFNEDFAAEIYKTFLYSSSKMILHHGGEVRAYDGDRVLGIFINETKNTSAAKCALRINHAVQEIINPAIAKQYPSKNYTLTHAVGIDSSKLLVSRIGYRGNNDLIWMGRAGNYAAKLCNLRIENYSSWITESVYKSMNDEVKFSNGQPMWEARTWAEKGIIVYRSKWKWAL